MPQPQPRNQSRLDDIQMLERQIMTKKVQELQRQQQVQELGDARQHNYINQQYALNKQLSRDQFPPLINRTPICDPSERFMAGNINLMHPQGFSNGTGFNQPQGQVLCSMRLVSPQLDASLYGTPVSDVGNNLGRYSQLLEASQGSENTFEKGNNNQQEEPITQSSSYSNSLSSYNNDASSNQIGMQEGSLVFIGDFQEKNLFGQVPAQALHGNFEQVNTLQRPTLPLEVGGRQEQAGWPGQFPGKVTNRSLSQNICSLDPLEQKILFNTADNNWDTSFGISSNISSEVLRKPLENTDDTSAFPSLQSGSWSALMQSAVAETSSSDAGLQEEWSGLSFQNSELSTDNRPSNFIDSGKQHPDSVNNGLQTVSALKSKPELHYKNLNMTFNFPGFQQPGIQFSLKEKDGVHLETSRESNQQHSPRNNNQWLDSNSLQKQTVEGNQQGERLSSFQSAWLNPNYEHSESDAYQEGMSMYSKGTQAGGVSGLEQVRSDNVYANHHISESNKLHYGNDTDGFVEDGRMEYEGNNQHHRSSSPQKCNNAYNGASKTYEEQQCIERENSHDSYHSNASKLTITGHDLKQNVWQHKSNSRYTADSNQLPSGQVLYQQIPQGSCGYELGYAEQFKFSGNVSSNDPDFEKRRFLGIQRNLTEDVSPRNHDHTSAFFDASFLHGPNMTAQTMVDTSKNYLPGVRVGSRDSTPFSEVPQVGSPDTFASQSDNKPFSSQTFGLRLSPPSQRTPVSNCFESCRSSRKMENSGDTVSLGLSLVRNQLQSQHQLTAPIACESNYKGQKQTDKCSIKSEDLRFGGEQAPEEANSQLNSSGTLGPVPQKGKLACGLVPKGFFETDAVDPGTLMTNSNQQAFDWALRNVNQVPNISDLEVFGCSLEPSHKSSQNYSLLQQVHLANKSGCESDLTVQQSNANTGQQLCRDFSGIQNAVNIELKSMPQISFRPTPEEKLQPLSSEIRGNQLPKSVAQPLLRDANQETVTFGQYSSPGASDAAEQSQISLQMVPSWVKQYGTLRNGQMFDPRTAHLFSPGNMLEKFPKVNPGACHETGVWPTVANNLVAVTSLTPSYVLPPDVLDQNPHIMRPKKRKVAPFELIPWHKETSRCSQKLHNVRLSDLDWAEATNRFIEKVEDEAANTENSQVLRLKKRLAFTTQHMQRVFRPPPAVILGGDATSNCETVAYLAARLALGDACCLKSISHMLCDISDMSSEKLRTPILICDQESVKVVEDFLTWSIKLEANFLILEKSASISDTRVESQELEKFSMINHFVKYLSRGLAGAAQASTSSGTKRQFLQRYVQPIPMPRTVPEGAQCLSL